MLKFIGTLASVSVPSYPISKHLMLKFISLMMSSISWNRYFKTSYVEVYQEESEETYA